jgi:hypothetical protein
VDQASFRISLVPFHWSLEFVSSIQENFVSSKFIEEMASNSDLGLERINNSFFAIID